MKNKIGIAISGGIDSLTAAFLLKQEDHPIFGVYFLTGYENKKINTEYISDILKIKIYTVNIRKEFEKKIISYFIEEYKKGKTPNPCLLCNSKIKFGTILNHVKELGGGRLATGHYASVRKNTDNNRFRLFAGKDKKKDQSYFLSFLKPAQLEAAFFPLADYTKEEVKKIAFENRLIPETYEESYDICFIKNRSYAEFLSAQKNFTATAGDIYNKNGEIVGRHNGLHLFTIGQRRGINIPAPHAYYVLKLDTIKNRLIVGYKEDLLIKECFVSGINRINWPDNKSFRIKVKVRYRHKPASCIFYPEENGKSGRILFSTPQSSVTPGQCAVFYNHEEIIGAGIIEKSAL